MKRSHPQKDTAGSLEKESFINNMTLASQRAELVITFLPRREREAEPKGTGRACGPADWAHLRTPFPSGAGGGAFLRAFLSL